MIIRNRLNYAFGPPYYIKLMKIVIYFLIELFDPLFLHLLQF